MSITLQQLKSLPCWQGDVELIPLDGGITNVNYIASDTAGKFVLRVGDDIDVHQVKRFNELAASEAAFQAGISPRVVHHQPGVLVLDYIQSTTLDAEMVRDDKMLARILPLIKQCHRDLPKHLRGAVLMFWVFHVIRDYVATLRAGRSKHEAILPELLLIAEQLEEISNPAQIVFSHNDLLPANFLDDGERLWLIDWDYAGFNSPLFDLGGLASNNELSDKQEIWLLENYFETPLKDSLYHQYQAMKCASLLRETLWSMVSEIHSQIDFDYGEYSAQNLQAFRNSYNLFLNS